MIKYCPQKWHNWAKRSKRRRYRFRKMIFTSMLMRMPFHLMEIMILKEVDRINRDENVILAVIDSHVLVYLAIK